MARHSAKHSKSASPRPPLSRANWILIGSIVAAAVMLASAAMIVARGGFPVRAAAPQKATAQPVSTKSTSATVDTSATPVEVPALVGLKLDEAKLILKSAGLTVVVRREAAGRLSEPTVSTQDPASGALARTGAVVTIALPEAASEKKSASKGSVKPGTYVVCIDPGHQSRSDSKTEPIGPGSAVRKPRITGGTTGAFTGAPEYETVLQIATNLKTRLEAAGVTVVMTRTTNDENLSNAERAQLANAARADLLVRLHADSSTNEELAGISTLYPAASAWTQPIAESSKRAADLVQSAVVKRTRAVNAGVAERGDLAGFNWSTVPAVLVAVGYPSNRVEDRLLISPNYQDTLAQGMADGILTYLKGHN